MIGRFVDVHADLTRITVACAGTIVAPYLRLWGHRVSITDPAHVVMAVTVVAVRALSEYDALFGLDPAPSAALAAAVDLPVAR